jgi:hypothetical protein
MHLAPHVESLRALQDGVGVGHAEIAQLAPWYQHACAGVRQAKKLRWSDLENFTGEDTLEPAPTQRIIDPHQAEYPYVDKIITYSFIEAMSPEFGYDPVHYTGRTMPAPTPSLAAASPRRKANVQNGLISMSGGFLAL